MTVITETPFETRCEILVNILAFGKEENGLKLFEEFAEQYEVWLFMTMNILQGMVTPTEDGKELINHLWGIFLSDELGIEDTGFQNCAHLLNSF